MKSGLFLREFVTVPWVHLDIAGTGYYRKATAVRAARRDRRLARDARRAGAGGRRRRRPQPDPRPARPSAPGGDREPLIVVSCRSSAVVRRRRGSWRRGPVRDPLAGARRRSTRPAARSDWRTASSAVWSARSRSGCCRLRFWRRPARARAVRGVVRRRSIVGLATDLDQRLLPDVLTLPVIPVARVYALSGQNPLVGDDLLLAIARRDGRPARAVPARRSRSGRARSGSATSSCWSGWG